MYLHTNAPQFFQFRLVFVKKWDQKIVKIFLSVNDKVEMHSF